MVKNEEIRIYITKIIVNEKGIVFFSELQNEI